MNFESYRLSLWTKVSVMGETGSVPTQYIEETARLEALASYGILDTLPERSFDDLTEIAAAICGVPISLVSFVAEDRQWFKSHKGLSVHETPRELSFCAHTLSTKQLLIVPDAQLDPRFQSNGLVTGDPGIRFYAGAPIIEPGGHALGTVCVIDKEPRTLSSQQISALEALARQAGSLLEHRNFANEKARLADRAMEAKESAEASRQRLQLAVDAADLAAWYYDPARNIVGGDARMATLFGLSTPEASAERWISVIVPEDRERVATAFAASLTGAPYDIQFCIEVDGLRRSIHSRAKVTPRGDGTVEMIGICEDTTEETETISKLKKTAERLALAQNVSGAVTFYWDLEPDRLDWGGDCFGRPPSAIETAEAVFAFVHEADRPKLRETVGAAIEAGTAYHTAYRAYWPDSSLHWVSTSGKPLRNEYGQVTSVVGVVLDVTDRKLSEEALLRSEKLAAVGRLASTISHEINNPLEAVTNLLFLVRNSPDLSKDNQDHLAMADRELARVSHITAQTLRFHRSPLNPVPIRAQAVLNEVVELYASRFQASGIVANVKASPEAVFVGFEGDIRQVVNHLVGNAFDAMRKGGRLELRAHRGTNWRSGAEGTVITVADTGAGIDAGGQARLFEAFYSTKGIGGTGLGLWISRRIVHKHKGHLRFRSSTGTHHGTVFRLWLPTEVAASASESWAE